MNSPDCNKNYTQSPPPRLSQELINALDYIHPSGIGVVSREAKETKALVAAVFSMIDGKEISEVDKLTVPKHIKLWEVSPKIGD